jgi:hypothetical protein
MVTPVILTCPGPGVNPGGHGDFENIPQAPAGDTKETTTHDINCVVSADVLTPTLDDVPSECIPVYTLPPTTLKT